MIKHFQVRVALYLAVCTAGWAQEAQPAGDGQALQEPAPQETSVGRNLPLEVAGYVNFRYLNDDAYQKHEFYRDYSASLFLSKTAGRWRFHAELNADTITEYDSDGIRLLPRRPSLSVKLDSAFVNYNAHDWLQLQAGFLFIPTYWRLHRYQSTTLPVDEPLIDQNVFPTALKGGAVYGDKYFGDGGVSYIAYGGVDQQSEFHERSQEVQTERARVAGGKLTIHLPSRRFFRTFDVAGHRTHRTGPDGKPDELYGVELLIRKSGFEVLGEFAHGSLDVLNGVRRYIRQGYYIQPSYQITPKVIALARYERLDRDSRYADQRSLAHTAAGITYRPVPMVSLKIEGNRYEPRGAYAPAYYGVTTSLVWFFHLP